MFSVNWANSLMTKHAQIFTAIPHAHAFESFESFLIKKTDATLTYAVGFWHNKREDSAIVSILDTAHASNFETRVRALASDIKMELNQSLVLVAFSEVDLIEV